MVYVVACVLCRNREREREWRDDGKHCISEGERAERKGEFERRICSLSTCQGAS